MTDTQINKPLLIVIPLGIVLFILGVKLHLGGFTVEPGVIYGDNGDGFFNIWVMDHTARCLERGKFNLLDGRIFWPSNEDTFLWSDNLLVPAACFTVLRQITPDILAAFRLTTLLLSLLGFAAYFFLFYLLFRIAKKSNPRLPDWTLFFVPAFTYLATFSSSRLIYYAHFQNLSSLWLFVLVGGGIGYWYYNRRIFFSLMAVSEVILLYSTPYFAVLGACFIAGWFLLAFRDIPRILRENYAVLLVSLLVSFPLAIAYAGTGKNVYPAEYIHQMGMRVYHLYTPSSGPVKEWYEAIFSPLPGIPHESPAYLGLGIILAGAGIIIWRLPAIGRWLAGAVRRPWFWILLIALTGTLLSKGGWKEYTCWIGAAALAAILLLYIRGMARRAGNAPLIPAFAFLALTALLAYGLASGPRNQFVDQPINPSIWGLMAFIIPGASSMRAVGRMVVIGQGLIFALLLLTLYYLYAGLKKKGRTVLTIIAAGLIIIQFGEGLSSRAITNRYDPADFIPTTEERDWFSRIDGPVAVFPATPFQASTRYMLYFNTFPKIYLMNGYSARSTVLWDRAMGLGRRWREPTEEQMAYLSEKGVSYLVIWKKEINWRPLRAIREGERPILFENERFLVLAPEQEK